MDYGSLPPEINSARMYAGPGSGSFLAAAMAWGELATDLQSTAVGYRSVLTTLTFGPWLGASSVALMAAAGPYIVWLESSAAHASLTASQAGAAASAHETARGMTVPPPLIAANRALLAQLVATNFLGQNTAAIAATEAIYFQMWAQDAAAMYGYAAASAAATELTDFEEPAEMTDPAALARQAAAVAAASAQTAATDVQDVLAKLATAVPDTLQKLAAPVADSIIDQLIALYGKYIAPFMPTVTSLANSMSAVTNVTGLMRGLVPVAEAASEALQVPMAALGSALGGGLGAAGLAGGAAGSAAAGLGRATAVGALSVPPSWNPVTLASHASPMLATASSGEAAASGMNALPMAPLSGMVGQLGGRTVPQYGFRPSVMSRPPAAG